MSALTFKVGGDTSMLGGAMRRAKGMLGGLAGMGRRLALGGLAAGAAGAAAGMAGLAISARGVKRALDLGGELSDLSARTGIAVGELTVLRQAFQDNGVAAEKVGPTINKMQKALSDAGNGLQAPLRALDAMGISMEDMRGKTPLEQFQMMQEALAGMSDATLRTGAAMDIFGRSGGELQALFADAGAMGKARDTIGGQAEILERNAASFDRASDLLKSMGQKLQGLFVGMADFINPVLLPALEKLNKLDLAKYGQAAGRFVAVLAEAFREGALVGLLKDGLMIAAKGFVNALVQGVKGVVGFLAAALPPIVASAWSKMQDPMFWKGVQQLFQSMGDSMAAIILRATGRDEDAKWRDEAAKSRRSAGMDFINLAGDGQAVGETLRGALQDGAAAFSREMALAGPLGTSAERDRMRSTLEGLRRVVDDRQAQGAAAPAGPGPVVPEDDVVAQMVRAGGLRPLVSSLGRVGGAALVGTGGDGLDRERNGLLKQIERNTRSTGPMVAVFGS